MGSVLWSGAGSRLGGGNAATVDPLACRDKRMHRLQHFRHRAWQSAPGLIPALAQRTTRGDHVRVSCTPCLALYSRHGHTAIRYNAKQGVRAARTWSPCSCRVPRLRRNHVSESREQSPRSASVVLPTRKRLAPCGLAVAGRRMSVHDSHIRSTMGFAIKVASLQPSSMFPSREPSRHLESSKSVASPPHHIPSSPLRQIASPEARRATLTDALPPQPHSNGRDR